MPRLLMLMEYPTLSGGERSLLALLPRVLDAGYRAAVAAPSSGPLADALRRLPVEHLPFDVHDGPASLPQDALREKLARLLRRQRPDLLHANSLSMARLSGPVAAAAGVPSLGHLRDILRLSRRALGDLALHTQLLAVSRAVRDYHAAQGLCAEKIAVLYNGVDLDAFRPRQATGYLHRELGLPPSARLVAAVGQIGMRKGWDVLLDAMRVVVARPDVHLLIVGERLSQKAEAVAFEHDLRRQASVPPLTGKVHFLGRRTDVERLLGELTLLVHAAREEPLGRVLLEAAAAGVAVIATDVGGTREIFAEDTGASAPAAWLVSPEQPVQLAEAMQSLLADREARHALAARGRRRVERCFSLDRAAGELLAHYRQVLGEARDETRPERS